MKRLIIIVSGIFIGLFFMFFLVFGLMIFAGRSGELPPDGVEVSKAIGDQIVLALEEFRADHGRYPRDLDQLVPRYIYAIVAPTVRDRKWHYSSASEEEYYLQFGYFGSDGAYVFRRAGDKELIYCSAGF